jgi:hypothetical protein
MSALRRVLAFSSVVEAGTGLALMIDPAMVITLLLGAGATGVALNTGRCLGIGLLALALAWWAGGPRAESRPSVVLSVLTYNGLIALYLGYLGAVGHSKGAMLWPAVALHAAVALAAVWTALRSKSPG